MQSSSTPQRSEADRVAGDDVDLRPVTDADGPLLQAIYAASRDAEMSATGWPAAQRVAFLADQFRLQDAFYRREYPSASFDVIRYRGRPVGRLYVDRRTDELRIMDIALLVAERGRGIGGTLIEQLQGEARAKGLKVTLHVERWNPALAWYRRRGFRVANDSRDGVHLKLCWDPAT